MPVLEHSTGTEPERIIAIGDLGRRRVWPEPDLSAPIFRGRVVEIDSAALFDVRIVEFGEAKPSLAPGSIFLLDHRPAQAAVFYVLIIGGQILVLLVRKPPIL